MQLVKRSELVRSPEETKAIEQRKQQIASRQLDVWLNQKERNIGLIPMLQEAKEALIESLIEAANKAKAKGDVRGVAMALDVLNRIERQILGEPGEQMPQGKRGKLNLRVIWTDEGAGGVEVKEE